MNDRVKHYTIKVTLEGPVFIGSGQSIGKKEYLFDPRRKLVSIPDMAKLYQFLQNSRLMDAYETYMLEGWDELSSWMRQHGVLERQFARWKADSIDSGDAVFENRGKKEIATFLKDAYGCPYVPGSSLKGALRTVLLSSALLNRPQQFDRPRSEVRNAQLFGKRKNMLRRETDQLEHQVFRTLQRNTKRPQDAVNDTLSGFQVGDSAPLSVNDLTLCQKIDMLPDGKQRRLPILRECLKPGTELSFPLSIDTALCKITPKQIGSAAGDFVQAYEKYYLNAFPMNGIIGGGNLYLGGGCGFVSKTVLYPLLGKAGLQKTSDILSSQFKAHKHFRDKEEGVSPRTVKCTKYRGEYFEMGACTMEIV